MASLFYKKFALAKIHFKKLTINQLFGLLLSLQGFKIIPFFFHVAQGNRSPLLVDAQVIDNRIDGLGHEFINRISRQAFSILDQPLGNPLFGFPYLKVSNFWIIFTSLAGLAFLAGQKAKGHNGSGR